MSDGRLPLMPDTRDAWSVHIALMEKGTVSCGAVVQRRRDKRGKAGKGVSGGAIRIFCFYSRLRIIDTALLSEMGATITAMLPSSAFLRPAKDTIKGWWQVVDFSCPAQVSCPQAGDYMGPTANTSLESVQQMQRLLFLCVVLSLVTVLVLLYMLRSRPGQVYRKSDLDTFSRELFQGIYSAIEQLEVATANQTTADPVAEQTAAVADHQLEQQQELSQILSSVRYLEANQAVIAEGLGKLLDLWKKLDDSDRASDPPLLTHAAPLTDLTSELDDGATILDTSDSILVADMDTDSEFEQDSFS